MSLPALATPFEGEVAAPFLKWAGGKRALLAKILRFVPPSIETYYEPFVGAGAVFFALAAEGRFRRAVLADVNEELMDCYRALQSSVEEVIAALRELSYDRETYYRVRADTRATLDRPHRAARTIYLNKSGFNGLYRVNSRGEFNVPFGRHKNPEICDEGRLRAVARALQGVELRTEDFESTVAEAGPQDFIYFDPPYVPLSATANFTSYDAAGFGGEQQTRLAKLLRALGAAEVPALLSNSDCDITRRLYRSLPRLSVPSRRNINSDVQGRGEVNELLVRSFRFSARTRG